MKKSRLKLNLARTVAVLSLLSLFILPVCKPKPAPPPDENVPGVSDETPATSPGTVIARIGDKYVITWEEFTETYRIDPRTRAMNAETVERLLESFINQYLVYLDGLERGYDKNPEVIKQVERTKRQLISRYVIRDLNQQTPQVTQEQMREYYNQNPDNFKTTQINYILFYTRKYEGDAQKTRAAVEKAMKALKGGEEFIKVAEEVYGRSSPNVNMTVRKNQRSYYGTKFDESVWGVTEGELSGIIETSQGFIIFKVISRDTPSFEQAQPFIQNELIHGSGMNRIETFYRELRKKYPVTIDREALESKIPSSTGGPGMPPMRPGTPPMPPGRQPVQPPPSPPRTP